MGDFQSPSRAALLVVDLQVGMFNGERLAPICGGERLLRQAGKVIGVAREGGVPVVYVRHGGGAGHVLEPGTANWAIHPDVAPREGEVVIDKGVPDAFQGTGLAGVLAGLGVGRLVVMGAQSEVCVDTTCRRAFGLGFAVTLVSDGHSTWDNAALPAERIIAHTNETLAGWFVRLARADEVGGLLKG